MKKRFILVTALIIIAFAGWYVVRGRSGPETVYRFVTVERGDLEAVFSATGLIDAVSKVEVGTQVSGIVSEIFVDYNDTVEKGRVIARLDTTLLGIAVRDAQAGLERALAEADRAEREYKRIKEMYDQQTVSQAEMDLAEYNAQAARASLLSSRAGVERAKQSMKYATIRAPISGIVISRGVDVGQTVAASLSAPTLFVIANDLAHLQILASVDESDIGLIREDQPVRFRVQAYPEEQFDGVVRQVRLQSTIQDNVVNYTVVIDVTNPEGKLLPGMTATVDFIVRTATDVFKVANTALRFQPTQEMIEELRRTRGADQDTTATRRAAPFGGGQRRGGSSGAKRLFYLDAQGRLSVPEQDPVGQTVRIRNVPFEIIGVLTEKGQTFNGSDQDDVILAPYTTVNNRLAGRMFIAQIIASASLPDDVTAAKEEARAIMQESHRLSELDDDDFTVRSQVDVARAAQSTTRVMTLLLAAIAGISLVVGGIGIMNIMLVSVTERTREIGIRMAIGARGSDILTQFLVESVLISAIGGTIGAALGIAAAELLGRLMGWRTSVSPETIVVALVFSAAVGVFFGLYPARKAARLNPIEALRYE